MCTNPDFENAHEWVMGWVMGDLAPPGEVAALGAGWLAVALFEEGVDLPLRMPLLIEAVREPDLDAPLLLRPGTLRRHGCRAAVVKHPTPQRTTRAPCPGTRSVHTLSKTSPLLTGRQITHHPSPFPTHKSVGDQFLKHMFENVHKT